MRRRPVPASIVPALACLLLLASVACAQDDPTFEKLYQEARKAEAARDYRAALAAYEKVVGGDSEYRDALDRWDACRELAAWQEGLGGASPTAPDLVRLGALLSRFGRFAQEREAYRDAIALDARCADAHGHLAMSHYTGPNGSLDVVVAAITRFLETSPNRVRLGPAVADWEIYGKLRAMPSVLAAERKAAAEASKAGEAARAAAILEGVATGPRDLPGAYRTTLLAQAGELRSGAGDLEGARKAFEAALRHPACRATIDARLGLAALDAGRGDAAAALEHLRAAVAEGSLACREIAARRDRTFRTLFASEDAAVREEMERLADPATGDAPIRVMIRAACERARKEGKKVLLEWYGPYCPYVMSLEERLADPRIAGILEEKFVLVRMNQGAMHRGSTLDEEYGQVMHTYGVPCFFVLDPSGRVESIQRDAPLMSVPNRAFSVEKIAAWLEEAAG